MQTQKPYLKLILSPWIWKMAWREITANRKKIVIFMSAIILGVAAQVAITSFRDTLNNSIDNQAKELLGADLILERRTPFTTSDTTLIDSISTKSASEIRFASMVYQKNSTNTRLSQIRALEGPFPFYGELKTEPAGAFEDFENGKNAVVDESLLLQFNNSVGDSISVGGEQYKIAGILKQIPGEAAIVSVFGPRVYVPLNTVQSTSLLQRGSRVEYRRYLKLAENIQMEELMPTLRSYREKTELRYDTVEERKEDFGEAVSNMAKFLNMIGFIALLLGGIGVASSIHVYIKNKLSTIAVLHCVGASRRQTLLIYLLQSLMLGFGGALAGTFLGLVIQLGFPIIFSEFLPVEVEFYFSVFAVVLGLGVGILVSIVFALMPLLSIRKISPLYTLRMTDTNLSSLLSRTTKAIIYLSVFLLIAAYAIILTENIVGAYFALGVAVSFAILTGVAKLLIKATRSIPMVGWSYEIRQGIANLYRPNNQTISLVLTLGIGSLLIFSMLFSQQMLLNELKLNRSGDQANLVFFDIQPDQIDPLVSLLKEREFPVKQRIPMVTMRLEKVRGKTTEQIKNDTTDNIDGWTLRHEYRSTYRDSLSSTETLIKGEFIGKYDGGLNGTVPVTLAENVFEDLSAQIGDTLVFNVQGMPLKTYISGVRKVDWQRVQPNFLAVFPTGVLEPAPQIFVTVTSVDNAKELASIQSAIVSKFPNVSSINLQLILNTVQAFLDKISFAIQFMALFSIFTGLIVLLSSVALSRFQRLKESVLLKTLGAQRRQIIKITGVEYLLIGFLSSLTGLIIALGVSWLLGYFYFNLVFVPSWWSIAAAVAFFSMLIVFVGMFASRDLFKKSPLEILRLEGV